MYLIELFIVYGEVSNLQSNLYGTSSPQKDNEQFGTFYPPSLVDFPFLNFIQEFFSTI